MIGAGGHARSVLEVLLEQGQPFEVVGILDDQYKEIGSLYGIPVIGDISSAPAVFQNGVLNAVVAFGSNALRVETVKGLEQFTFPAIVSKKALIGKNVSVGAGTVIMPGTCLRIDVQVGKFCIVNTNACVDHECVIGDYVHIAPGCAVSGKVTMGDGVFLGTGTKVIDRINIGNWSTVAAGGVVVKDIPSDVMVAGVPARTIRSTKSEISGDRS